MGFFCQIPLLGWIDTLLPEGTGNLGVEGRVHQSSILNPYSTDRHFLRVLRFPTCLGSVVPTDTKSGIPSIREQYCYRNLPFRRKIDKVLHSKTRVNPSYDICSPPQVFEGKLSLDTKRWLIGKVSTSLCSGVLSAPPRGPSENPDRLTGVRLCVRRGRLRKRWHEGRF